MSDDADDYSVWTDPATAFSVTYSLPLFHEIDALVNEGFRRIPHGGIENGGVLLGEFVEGGVRVDAFRPIECEHASGPSFQLSVRDIDRLRIQIAKQDANLAVVGWFISHSRSELLLTEREASVFEYLFPAQGSITVLAKPEKFKATRFAFLVDRRARDGTENSIILPLPGRRSRAPAPPEPRAAMPPPPPPPQVVAPAPPSFVEPPAQLVQKAETAPPVLASRKHPSTPFWMMMGAAAAFACLAAYGFFLAGVPPVVPLSVSAQGSTLIVSWPPEQSRTATEAEIRVNGGPPIILLPDQKAAGTTPVRSDRDSVKIELILRRWARESHSIVRYLRTAKASVKPASPAPASEPVAPGP